MENGEEITEQHKYAVLQVSKCGSKDYMTGDTYLTKDDLRVGLGARAKVPRHKQFLMIKELVALGLIQRLNNRYFLITTEQKKFCKKNSNK